MRIWVTGARGMLGQAVETAVLSAGHKPLATGHFDCPTDDIGMVRRFAYANQPDVIINCAGRLPGAHVLDMINANTVGPHNLASLGIRLVHMSTDCVYSGAMPGSDDEDLLQSHVDQPDPTDAYGRTMLAGEPQEPHVLVVRGSFIGTKHGFLSWLLNARGDVDGWANYFWNGTTVEAMARTLVWLAEGKRTGVVHVASQAITTRAKLMEYFRKELNLPISIAPVRDPFIWRALKPDIVLPRLSDALTELCKELRRLPICQYA